MSCCKEVDSRGFNLCDPARAIDWIPTIERKWLSLEERARRLNFGSVELMKKYADEKGIKL